jgi:septal ring factor EnvC (AmiA/AmiB activator)
MPLTKQIDAKLRTKERHPIHALTVAMAVVLLGGAVLAYSSGARNSLLRSRDQVADQRSQLERAYSDVDRKIQELQQQKWTLNRYLQDCDRTIKDIDRALSAQDAAYRNAR